MAMSEAAKEAKRIKHREWQRKNKDKIKAYTERYWEKKAREMGIIPESEAEEGKPE